MLAALRDFVPALCFVLWRFSAAGRRRRCEMVVTGGRKPGPSAPQKIISSFDDVIGEAENRNRNLQV